MDIALEIFTWSLPYLIPFVVGAGLSGFFVWSRMSAKLDARAREMSRTVVQPPRLAPEDRPPARQVPVQKAFRAQPHDADATVVMNVIRDEDR